MNPKLKSVLRPIVRVLSIPLRLIGFNVAHALAMRHLPRYLADRAAFRRAGGRITQTIPVLEDYSAHAGSASGHYFHQDLLVAGLIHKAAPRRHVDVGSRIDGFVAHVASFRPIEIIDIRPMPGLVHAQINFLQGDLMQLDDRLVGLCDSLSCLHALEHFGLGRYGDPIDPDGHMKGFANLHRMLEPGGTLYLSFPVGVSAVHFNAQRVFDPAEVMRWCEGRFELHQFNCVDDQGALQLNAAIEPARSLRYGCGIFVLKKLR